jgi:transposase
MRRDQRYDCAYIFGAVCPARDAGVALVLPEANIPAMNLHLEHIERCVETNAHAVILIDGAGWHRQGGALAVPDNITLLPIPPYSPELNAQENVWQYLRQNHLAGRVFDTYEDIVDACCAAWNALSAVKGRIASISSREWLRLEKVKN